jgi:hypothetical protein
VENALNTFPVLQQQILKNGEYPFAQLMVSVFLLVM